ncbi:hypothetical protein SADUNF_Sadunf18G0048800 [Salix dunnii]|uniref:Uncharacterized protein n=1 Tax=Salix dunnii TaxID=1413687 RepID=A0A835J7U2_9ROSI|nr:hypothetical protein SADUNF_Sadunf18G0048800 [Salix dunnii]
MEGLGLKEKERVRPLKMDGPCWVIEDVETKDESGGGGVGGIEGDMGDGGISGVRGSDGGVIGLSIDEGARINGASFQKTNTERVDLELAQLIVFAHYQKLPEDKPSSNRTLELTSKGVDSLLTNSIAMYWHSSSSAGTSLDSLACFGCGESGILRLGIRLRKLLQEK